MFVSSDFEKERKELRMLYKRLKAGLTLWKDIPEDKRVLLRRYYGVGKKKR